MKNPQRFQNSPETQTEPTRWEVFLSRPSWCTRSYWKSTWYAKMGRRQREKFWTKVFFICCGAFVALAFGSLVILETLYPTPSSNASDNYTRTRVGDEEFNYSYNRFRDSGMSESEAGAAARATSNFLDKQRVQRAAEAARQR